jgi:class 3 adenylate cyclase
MNNYLYLIRVSSYFQINSQGMQFLNDTYKISIFFLSVLYSCLPAISASLPDSLIKSTSVIRSFDANKVINNSPNYSILFDDSGLMYLGQEDKINIYNGFSWSSVHLKGEILLSRNEGNTIFFASDHTLGYLTADSSLKIEPRYLNSFLPERARKFNSTALKCAGKTVYFQSDSLLISYSSKEFKILDTAFSGAEIFNCRKNLLTLKPGNRIDVFKDTIKEKSIVFPGSPIVLILEHQEGYLIVNRDNKYIVTNDLFEVSYEWHDLPFSKPGIGVYLKSHEYFFADQNNILYLCDKTGKVLTRFNNPFDIPVSEITNIIQEPSGNIWILQDKAITRIEYPSSIGIVSSLPNNIGNIRDTKSFDNKIFIAATRGLYYIESPGNKIIQTSLANFCFKIIPTSQGLLALTNDKVFLINKMEKVEIYSGKMLDQSWNPVLNSLFVSEPGKIRILTLKNNRLIDTTSLIPPVTPIKILSIGVSLWISNGESLYEIKNNDSSDFKPIKHETPESTGITELFAWQHKLAILTDDKIFSYENDRFNFERAISNDLCSGEFLSLNEDNDGNILFLTRNSENNSLVWFGNQKENSFTKIILPSFISLTNPAFDYIGNDKLILSSGMQVYILDIKSYVTHARKFEVVLREILAGDQTLFKGISYDYFRVPLRTALNNIPFTRNTIRIELSSTNYVDNKVSYQYLLSGEDKIWSEWSSNSYIILSGLREGKYDLKIRCKDYLNETSEVTSLIFRINAPFYRSVWAYILYCFLGGIILFIGYKTYLFNLHKVRGANLLKKKNSNDPNHVPIIVNNVDPATISRKFDFFSNIDEEKGKDKARWDKYEMVTVLFSDIQGFTKIAESMNPELLIDELDRFFFHFDSVVEKYNIEKIKTIGDAYMAAGGIPKKSITNPIEVVLAALEMQNYMKQLKKTKIDIWDLRIGIHSGPVIAGIIGHKKRSFDIWGDTVNTASRMESTGEAGKVNISSETYKLVKDYFICEYRGRLPVKYKGNIDMYFVKGLRPELSINLAGVPNRKFFLKLQMLRLSDLEEILIAKLEAELNKNLYFHNYEYARHLFEYSQLLAKAANMDLEETLLLRTAALFLNIGFIGGYDNQENRSAEYARAILPDYNYTEKQIGIVSNLILSSKWPPEPQNMLEMALYDIKMEYIGRADFIRLYKLLFLEQNQYMRSVDVLEFKRAQLEIIKNYQFFTDSARRLREISLEEQLERIKNDDWK